MALGIGDLKRLEGVRTSRHLAPDWSKAEVTARLLMRKVVDRLLVVEWAS